MRWESWLEGACIHPSSRDCCCCISPSELFGLCHCSLSCAYASPLVLWGDFMLLTALN